MTERTISHYEILECLGEGGMGTVYRAVDVRLGRPVAIKVLRPDVAANAGRRKRFVHEARAASALNHPNIATVYDIGQDNDVDFIAMEYVAGTSLAQILAGTRLRLGDALEYAAQIADALAAAHAVGIVHRDLKPANIMVSDKGRVKVVDFGLAKLTEWAAPAVDEQATTNTAEATPALQTEEGTILGTAAYMSPEQAEGKPADLRSDVFSFGAVLYEMVTGRRAFAADGKMATLAAVLDKEPEPLSQVIPGVPRELEKLIVRCLRKSPGRRWQSMADLKVTLEELRDESESARSAVRTLSAPVRRAAWHSWPAVAALTIAAAGLTALGYWTWKSKATGPVVARPFLMRLTSDIGWTDNPAISPDGRLLAYASDRSGERNLDIWVQQIPEGSPVRLTRHGGDNVEPSLSADGSRIAFQSSRQGGGVYVVPTLGGEERLLMAGAFSPRFSPDGRWIAYGIAEAGGGAIYVAPASGGPPARIASNLYVARSHVWSPDGRHLLFWGQREREAPPENNVDWYVASVDGGPPVRTGARDLLMRDGFEAFQGLPAPDAWAPKGDHVVFHGHVGDSWNIWQIAISAQTWQIHGSPERVTLGTTDEAAPSVASDGRVVFISRTMGADIWSLPIDPAKGKVTGSLKRLTEDAADDYDPTLSDDGATLVFRSRRAGRFDVFMKNLKSNAETALTQTATDEQPVISRDGKRVAYSSHQKGRIPVFVVGAGGGATEEVCSHCGDVEQWTPDNGGILYVTSDDPSAIGLLRIGAAPNHEWLKDARYGIFNPRVSPDGRHVAFNARTNRLAPARIFLALVQGPRVASENEWIPVADDAEAPAWSPDGNLLYFWSNRDGSPCLWAQRLDPHSRKPAGAPLNIHHFHSRGLSWKNLYLGAPDVAVGPDRIIFNLGEHTGNIWMTRLPAVRD